jgi:poly-gamma-glutamate capsule biosynthesis protein CapA/YwtB (metallophosphatase superfamily)
VTNDLAGPIAENTKMDPMRLFLCGDVMIGRGIDQILPHPCDPRLHEAYVVSAMGYVRLAEQAGGPISRPVGSDYVWGAALEELGRRRPDARIVNLETSITRSDAYLEKGINYRISPENARCLEAARIDCCVLANNHVLDWGRDGLLDTLTTLGTLRIKTAGAGRTRRQAMMPAVLEVAGKGRVVVHAFASPTSGTPHNWAAGEDIAGVNVLPDLSDRTAELVGMQVEQARRPGDIVVVSLHWGGNWGYAIPDNQRRFAHRLIGAGVSLVYGHSSHHAKAVEVYRNRLILYGCGDFLNDYEGIRGHEEFRDDLALMYFAEVDPFSADLVGLELVPLQIRRFSLIRAVPADVAWLGQTLERESRSFDTYVKLSSEGTLKVSWPRA